MALQGIDHIQWTILINQGDCSCILLKIPAHGQMMGRWSAGGKSGPFGFLGPDAVLREAGRDSDALNADVPVTVVRAAAVSDRAGGDNGLSFTVAESSSSSDGGSGGGGAYSSPSGSDPNIRYNRSPCLLWFLRQA